jgi:hypothetical protein
MGVSETPVQSSSIMNVLQQEKIKGYYPSEWLSSADDALNLA